MMKKLAREKLGIGKTLFLTLGPGPIFTKLQFLCNF
jgi:hypothetical protein